MNDDTLFLPDLSPVGRHGIHARFDGGALSSDGGVLLLREIERGMNFSGMLASCLQDARDPGRTIHTHTTMIRERMFAIACGYEDCDDLDALRHDPAFRIACERLPDSGPALASHGDQQLSLFNTHAQGYCFHPIHIYDAAAGRPVCFLLRPGKRPSGAETAMVLRHVIRRIRRNWPGVAITARGDGHYGTPEVMDLLEQQGYFYILGLPGNSRLKTLSAPWSKDVATRWRRANKEKLRRFFQTRYGARSWTKERLVIARVEASRQGTDVRFIVTNLGGRSKHLYEKVYCARGTMENLLLGHAGMPCQTADQGTQTLHQIRPHVLPSLGGQPVPAVSAHRCLLVAAEIARRSPKAFALTQRNFRNHSAHVPEDRGARQAVEIPH